MEKISNNLKEELTKMLEENEDVQGFVIKTIGLLQENGSVGKDLTEEQIEELCLNIMTQMLNLSMKDAKKEE